MIGIRKDALDDLPIEGLSTGQQEVLGLLANIYTSRHKTDVYLIDEPEVHLNWHLEEKLFAYLDDFCRLNGKQAIVATHSRTMFASRFLPKTQFFSWQDGKIVVGRNISADQQQRIAGDAIEVVRLGAFTRPTFFVEDAAHSRFIEAVAAALNRQVSVSECGNSSNVKSLYALSQSEGDWQNSYFMIDGDNQGNPYPGAARFIHLPHYCSDTILLCPETLATLYGRSLGNVQMLLLEIIRGKRNQIFRKNRFFDFLVDALQPADLTADRLKTFDASLIVDELAARLGTDTNTLTKDVVAALHADGQLQTALASTPLFAAMANAPER
jgi:energy-coupling factor transporter ATP-binding protein EcfA2